MINTTEEDSASAQRRDAASARRRDINALFKLGQDIALRPLRGASICGAGRADDAVSASGKMAVDQVAAAVMPLREK